MGKTISYLRVSTKEQDDKGGFPRQRKYIQYFADANNYKIVREFAEDVSGRKRLEERPQLLAAIQYAIDHEIEFILVEKSNRLARNSSARQSIKDKLIKHKMDVIYCTTGKGAVRGRIAGAIDEIVADENSIDLAIQLREGKYSGVERIGIPGHQFTTYGYDMKWTLDERGQQVKRELVINKKHAPTIRKIFKMYATGKHSLSSIQRYLVDAKIPTPSDLNGNRHPNHAAGYAQWNRPSIRGILTKSVYKGIYEYGSIQVDQPETYPVIPERIYISVPAIIDEELWEKVNKLLQENTSNRPTSSPYPLKGKMRCAICGNVIYRKQVGEKYIYYECKWTKDSRNKCEPRLRIPAKTVDIAVALKVIEIASAPEEMKRELAKRKAEVGASNIDLNEKVQQMKTTIQKEQTRMAAHADAYADGVITRKQMNQRALASREIISELESKLSDLNDLLAPMPEINFEVLEEMFGDEWLDQFEELQDYVLYSKKKIQAFEDILTELYNQLNVAVRLDREAAEIRTGVVGIYNFVSHTEGTLQEQNPSPPFGMGFLCYDTNCYSS